MKPIFISGSVWTGLKTYWCAPRSVRVSALAARMTPDPEDNLPIVHTSRQTPHAGVALL